MDHTNDIQSEVKDLIQELPELISFKTMSLYVFVRTACLLIPLPKETPSEDLLLMVQHRGQDHRFQTFAKAVPFSKSVVVSDT